MRKYDFEISYIKGTMNKVENALSQRPFIFSIMPLKTNLWEKTLKLQLEYEWCREVKTGLENEAMKIPKYEGYVFDKYGLLRYNKRIYVPSNEEVRDLILSEAHRDVYMSHLGVKKIYVDLK